MKDYVRPSEAFAPHIAAVEIEARIKEVLHLQSTLDDMPLSDEAQAAFIAYTRGRLTALRDELERDNG